MESEEVLFQKLTQSLTNLSEEELRKLAKLVLDTHIQMHSNEDLKQRQFSAEAEFSAQKVAEENPSFESIKYAVANLNPAEIWVLRILLTFHLDKAHFHDGQRVICTWGSNNNHDFFRGDIMVVM
jgi:hypothetical protein